MRQVTLLFWILVSLLLPAQVALQKQPDDKDKLQGSWTVVSLESERGEKITTGKVGFFGDALTFDLAVEKVEGTMVLYPSKMPRAIDLIFSKRNGKGNNENVKMRAIYVFEGDTLKLCWCAMSGLRPEEFTAKGDNSGQDLRLLILRREKK